MNKKQLIGLIDEIKVEGMLHILPADALRLAEIILKDRVLLTKKRHEALLDYEWKYKDLSE